MKKLILVNGVPASGKSTVARVISQSTGWPLLTLDTVKEALFSHLGKGDRDYNRLLGKASYQAIFSLVGDWPDGSHAIIDAWFGFQPFGILQEHLGLTGNCAIAEIWCHAKPDVIGARYRARLSQRHDGHLGADYVPELIALAETATALGNFPLFGVDTTRDLDVVALMSWLTQTLDRT
jgi:predicted kinase